MVDPNPTVTAGPPPQVDVQDPLPEGAWLWRRVFVFLVTGFVCWQVRAVINVFAVIGDKQPALVIEALVNILHWLLFLVILLVTYYLIAPSAEQITKMIQMARLLKDSTFTSVQRAVSPGGAVAETRTEVAPTVAAQPDPSAPTGDRAASG